MARMFGAREVVLGVGTVTSVKERTQDAEWVSARAVADAVDGWRWPSARRAAPLAGRPRWSDRGGGARHAKPRAVRRRAQRRSTEAALADATVGR